MCDPTVAWAQLSDPWRFCLELAWEAYGAGTVAVGAVLVDGDGAIVATGRNRIHEPSAPPGQIAGTLLAHAEVNALIGLSPTRRYHDHVLYSSLEPCLLCVGAAHRCTIGAVRYAGAEPYRGAAPHRTGPAGGETGRVAFEGPRDDVFGRLAAALGIAYFLTPGVYGADLPDVVADELPEALATARALTECGARELAACGRSLATALPELRSALQ